MVSLITVCFNSAKTIATAMESVLRQKDADFEYWVIDGGSKDGTVEIIQDYEKKFDGRMHWISEKDRGMYDAINKGIRRSKGNVVGILNADDFLEMDSVLAEVQKAFEAHTETQAVYADIRFVKECEEVSGDTGKRLDALRKADTHRYYSAKRWRPWMHHWGFMPPHPSVYIRREQFEKLGGYKLGYSISADFELMVRFLCRNRIPSRYIPSCWVGMRTGGKSTGGWRSNLKLNQENVRANRENGYFSCLLMMLPKYGFKIWEFILPRLGGKSR